MPSKTDRILSYLPGTFRPSSRQSALRAVADAFGTELQQAENSLAAVMAAHWAKHADRGDKFIDDLACLASLYGLAPREDESVEEFREHLYRYVRTFLDGTVTVQGILRISAEAIGLHIADDYKDMDAWWRRAEEELVTIEARGDDACQLIFGTKSANATGRPATQAHVTGKVDLSHGVDLRANAALKISIDDAAPVEVFFGEMQPIRLDQIVSAINARLGIDVARSDGSHLIIASKTAGQASRLEIQDVDNDAAELVLGLAPRTYYGKIASHAQAKGAVDLSSGTDLSENRFLRLALDGILAEIDCAGPDPVHTELDQICNAINNAFKLQPPVASHEGGRLKLTSPSKGFSSSISFQNPAAQDAASLLFGEIPLSFMGLDDQPASVTGKRNIGRGIDLSQRFHIRLSVDGKEAVTINCTGHDPANTRPSEIVASINAAARSNVASYDGRHIILSSPTIGPASQIILQTPSGQDATEDIFGIPPRRYSGESATSARITTLSWPESGYDLRARHILKISVDGGTPAEIDLRAGAKDPGSVLLDERLIEVIKGACSKISLSKNDEKLVFSSPSTGSASILSFEPLESTKRRRFLTRAIINDEAAMPIFGFISKEERGRAGSKASLKGEADLSRGVDLSKEHHLRISLDDLPSVDIDCAGRRPRATLIKEVVDKINKEFPNMIATQEDGFLVLTSRTIGAASRIALEPPLAEDALECLLGIEPGLYRGKDATALNFVSTVDLSQGIDLEANSAIRLGVDGEEAIQIDLCGPEPCHKTLNEIVLTINIKLGFGFASHDGRHIVLTLLPFPDGIKIRELVFALPGGQDATKAIFGIEPTRSYHSSAAGPAKIKGIRNLSQGIDLRRARYLQLSIDDLEMQVLDCASKAIDPGAVRLDEVKDAINEIIKGAASDDGSNHLVIKSSKIGWPGRITLERFVSGDARKLLFGSDAKDAASGSDPAPAAIAGEAHLLTPVNLSSRSLLRLKVDGERAEDIDVAGSAPETTSLEDIVAAINRIHPNLASATDDSRLKLTSPTSGEESRISLLPLRYMELQEYLPEVQNFPPDEGGKPSSKTVKHGDSWSLDNNGAADVFIEGEIDAPFGAVGPALVNSTLGWQVRLLTTLDAGRILRLWRDPIRGLRAEICTKEKGRVCRDKTLSLAGNKILVGPLGGQAFVPFTGAWNMTGNGDEPASLQLNNPMAPRIVRLKAQRATGHKIAVEVKESNLSAIGQEPFAVGESKLPLSGRIRSLEGVFQLVNYHEDVVALLQKGPEVNLEEYRDCVVSVTGSLFSGQPMLLIVSQIARLFDAKLRLKEEGGQLIEENYEAVTIGVSLKAEGSLIWQINAGSKSSGLVFAEELDKSTVLRLPQGRSEWRYLECQSSRFDQAHFFDPAQSVADRFAGLECDGCICAEYGIFDVSRFSNRPPELMAALYAPSGSPTIQAANVAITWQSHSPGSFIVNLPADLPDRFGGRFNQSRFGQAIDKPEMYERAVTEPEDDERYLVKLIKAGLKDPENPGQFIIPSSNLVTADGVDFASFPLDYKAVKLPFREPQHLTLGREDRPAQIYIFKDAEDPAKGFIKLAAKEKGAWGNEIAVSARAAGPAMYDLSIIYKGARFENARQAVLGMGPPSKVSSCKKGSSSSKPQESASNNSLPALIREILKPGSIGVLQAKAAGVKAEVSRDQA